MKNDKIAILIKRLALEFDKIAIPELTKYDLTPAQFKILKYLYFNEYVIQNDIQKAFSMTNPTVTGILQNMEKANWIKRIQNPNDSRSKLIKLTKKANNKKEELIALGNKIEDLLTTGLTISDKKELLNLLNKMMEGIK